MQYDMLDNVNFTIVSNLTESFKVSYPSSIDSSCSCLIDQTRIIRQKCYVLIEYNVCEKRKESRELVSGNVGSTNVECACM